jgi:hypothetical protein
MKYDKIALKLKILRFVTNFLGDGKIKGNYFNQKDLEWQIFKRIIVNEILT